MDGWKDEIYWNSFWAGLFSGAMLVLGRVTKNTYIIYLFCKCFTQLCNHVAIKENVCVCVCMFQGTINTTHTFNLYLIPLSIPSKQCTSTCRYSKPWFSQICDITVRNNQDLQLVDLQHPKKQAKKNKKTSEPGIIHQITPPILFFFIAHLTSWLTRFSMEEITKNKWSFAAKNGDEQKLLDYNRKGWLTMNSKL